jgi:hypothetical protein
VGWLSLGTKQPSFTWDDWNTPVIGNVAVRITQTYNPSEVSFLNKLQISEYYATGERRYLKTLYPSTAPRLYEFFIPQALQDAGYTTRYFSIRHGFYGVADVANWQTTLEIWQP